MIYTITLNPSIDYILSMDHLEAGSLNRSHNETILPGGKGINVSRVLKRLNIDSTVFGFGGGFTGRYIEEFLQKEGISSRFVQVNGLSRINVKIMADQETEINANGPAIEESDLKNLLQMVAGLKSGDVLVLAGSIPASIPKTFYQTIAEAIQGKDILLVVDAEKNLLEPVLSYRPFFIKPNHHELGEMFHTTIKTVEDAIHYGKKLLERGVQNVIVSMAEKGSVLLTEQAVWQADVPQGKLKSSVGAGDSTVAGFLAGIARGYSLEKAFQLANASGSATAFSIGLCTKDQVEQLFDQVKVKRVM